MSGFLKNVRRNRFLKAETKAAGPWASRGMGHPIPKLVQERKWEFRTGNNRCGQRHDDTQVIALFRRTDMDHVIRNGKE
jgi:hypothetical protein